MVEKVNRNLLVLHRGELNGKKLQRLKSCHFDEIRIHDEYSGESLTKALPILYESLKEGRKLTLFFARNDTPERQIPSAERALLLAGFIAIESLAGFVRAWKPIGSNCLHQKH